MEELTLYCYNKGCGKKFLESENNEESCRYHSGGPIFHDAMKGWSCCKKRSTDFTEFLNIPGCTIGPHSNVKPEIEKLPTPKVEEIEEIKKDIKPEITEPVKRPSHSEVLVRLENSISDTLKDALDERIKNLQVAEVIQSGDNQKVEKGTSCKNNGCTMTYVNEDSDLETCVYHPGVPVFHEGMKYWSCCQQKTTDFNVFLSQSGCSTAKHLWHKQSEDLEKKVACRFDWHQTASFVTISIFSKLCSPQKSWVEANKVKVAIHIVFDAEKNLFTKEFILNGIIDPSMSSVKMMPSKVEINLKKLEPGKWPTLEF